MEKFTDKHLRSFEEIHQNYEHKHSPPKKKQQLKKTTQEIINIQTFKVVDVKKKRLNLKSQEAKTVLKIRRRHSLQDIFFTYFDDKFIDLIINWNVKLDINKKLPAVCII